MRFVLLVALVGCADMDVDRQVWAPDVEQTRVEVSGRPLQLERYVYKQLTEVEAELRAVPSTNPARAVAIDRLREYRERRIFPHNHHAHDITPVFIDRHGTRCAMAHLIEQTGATEFVQRIASTANLAKIEDLAGDPELVAWLDANGLTIEEAARIQPYYPDNKSCIQAKPIDMDAAPGMQPDLQVSITEQTETGEEIQQLAPCRADGVMPCYEFMLDDTYCAGGYPREPHYAITIDRERTWLPGHSTVEIAVEN